MKISLIKIKPPQFLKFDYLHFIILALLIYNILILILNPTLKILYLLIL